MRLVITKINTKQTKMRTADGGRYKAQPAESATSCTGCEFKEDNDCPSKGDGVSDCSRSYRTDGASIIWVKRKDKDVGSN